MANMVASGYQQWSQGKCERDSHVPGGLRGCPASLWEPLEKRQLFEEENLGARLDFLAFGVRNNKINEMKYELISSQKNGNDWDIPVRVE